MRLTTLARKVELTPKKLVAFLESEGVELDNGVNTKLDDNIIHLVFENFAPEQIQDKEIEKPIEPVEETKESTHPKSEDLDSVKIPVANDAIKKAEKVEESEIDEKAKLETSTIEEEKIGTIEDLEGESMDDIDLIKVKKVKLEGIKVVGKIDLPEKPTKKEVEDTAAEENAEPQEIDSQKEKSKSKGRKFDRNRKKNRPSKGQNPLSYEERLKEEKREKLKKRRRRENEEKRRKKKYYEQNIKPKVTQPSRKSKKKKSLESRSSPKKEVVVHKNPIKRLWAWLNGKYDKY